MRLRCGFLIMISLCFAGCAAQYRWTVVESNRPDGDYGDWKSVEQTDEFGSYTFSIAKGRRDDKAFEDGAVRIVIQDDFIIRIYPGDTYICSEFGTYGKLGISAQTAWKMNDQIVRNETLYLSVSQSSDHFFWQDDRLSPYGWVGAADRFLHMLNLYDELVLRYTDACGEQSTSRFSIEGTHHNYTAEVAPT